MATKYYYLGGQRVAMRQDGELTYLHTDHLGSASLSTSATGAQVSEMRYYAYGGTRSGTMGTDRRYTGQRWEAGIGLYDYNARYYDPVLGRFVQADTVVPSMAHSQDFNRYSYVRGNSLKYTDPSGHATCSDMPWECEDTEWHYLSDKREASLAVYQQDQGYSNDCAIYSTVAARDVLLGGRMQASSVSNWVNSTWWQVPGRYRTLPGQATTPKEQARLFNILAASQNVTASAAARKGTTDELKSLLDQPDTVVLVTVGWNKSTGIAPRLMKGDGKNTQYLKQGDSFWGKAGINAHTMVLAAYDPEHVMPDGTRAPWGFINSWSDGQKMKTPVLWWMTDRDFNRVWDYSIPGIGANNMVVVTYQPI
jgi:RHS repeat-associated protein